MATTEQFLLKVKVQGQESVKKLSGTIQDLSNDVAALGNNSGVLGNSLGSLTSKLGPVGLAASAVAAAFGALGARALAIADQIGDITAATGISAGALMNFKESLIQAGGSAQSFEQFAKKLSQTIGEAAEGNEGFQKSFRDLGVYVRDANGQMRPTGEILRNVLTSLKAVEEPARRTALAVKLLGEEASRIDWTNVQAATDIATDEDIAALNRYNAAIERLLELLNRQVVSFFGSIAQDLLEGLGLLDGFEGKVTNVFNKLRAERDAAATGEFAGMTDNPYAGKTDAELKQLAREQVTRELKAQEDARKALAARAQAAATDPRRLDAGGDYGARSEAGLKAAAASQLRIEESTRQTSLAALQIGLDQVARIRKQAEYNIQTEIAKIRSQEKLTDAEKEAEIVAKSAEIRAKAELQVQDILKAQSEQIKSQAAAFDNANAAAEKRLQIQNTLALASDQERAKRQAIFDLDEKYNAYRATLEQQKKNASQETIALLDKQIEQSLELQQQDRARLGILMDQNAAKQSQLAYDAQIRQLDDMRAQNDVLDKREALERSIANLRERDKTAARALFDIENQRAAKLKEIERDRTLSAGAKSNLIANYNSEYDARRRVVEDSYALDKAAQDSYVEGWNGAFQRWQQGLKTNAEIAADTFNTITRGFEDSIVNFVKTGKLSFKDLANTLIEEFVRIQARKLFLGIFGGASGGADILGSLLGRATGGPVSANTPYMVGERGPELFVPSTAGNIVNNNQLGMSQPQVTQVTYNINATDAASFRQLLARDPEYLYAVTEKGRSSIPGGRR